MDIRRNVSAIPISDFVFSFSQLLNVKDNPIIFPPHHIVEDGIKSIRKFLKQEAERREKDLGSPNP
jgi:hypothetical protein